VPSSLPPRDFFLSIGEAKAQSFAAINSATARDAVLILAGLLGAICVVWAGRNIFRGPIQGLRQPAADRRQFTREIGMRPANSVAVVAAQPAEEAGFVVWQELTRSLTGRRVVSSTSTIRAVYSARGPPKH
jgi:hypothetical protein